MFRFNPGWDGNTTQELATFTDVGELQGELKAHGEQFQQEADESTSGPAGFVSIDPDVIQYWAISTCKKYVPGLEIVRYLP
jgi:hypothetical protein